MMRAGLSEVRETLTPESANILNQSIAEASRRTHGQTTPLHVAATLLSLPTGLLRQACVQNSTHPFPCSALELCLNVALEQLPAMAAGMEEPPPLSNALAMAIRRAQVHQRKQQAMKVELSQLIISILDDPNVGRVMKEAGLQSSAVKLWIELYLVNSRGHQLNRFEWGRIGDLRGDDVNKVFEIVVKRRRAADKQELEKDLMILKNVTVISVKKGASLHKVKELSEVVEGTTSVSGRVILDLGNLKWLVEEQHPTVAKISKLLAKFNKDGNGEYKVWMIVSANCEIFTSCQVPHYTLDNVCDLQPLPMPSFPPPPPSVPSDTLVRNPSDRHLKPITDIFDPVPICPQCCQNYEKELAKLTVIHNSSSQASLPHWLQLGATQPHSQGKTDSLEKTQGLHKKWRNTCLHLHQKKLAPPNLLTRPIFQRKLHAMKPVGEAVQLNINSPPPSPVSTDLVLGRKPVGDRVVDKFSNTLDADAYKELLMGLMEKAWWQGEAATAVASAIIRSKLDKGKRRGGDVWLLFSGPDRVGKKKMAMVIAEQLHQTNPLIVCLGTRRGDDMTFRGKTAIDQIADAARTSAFSVIMLQDINEANMFALGNIKRATEHGRITDSYGREVSLGNVVFIVTGNWSTTIDDCQFVDETSGNFHFRLIVEEKSSKRHGNWFDDEDLQLRQRKERCSGLSLDLNLSTLENGRTYGSYYSSDATIDYYGEFNHVNRTFSGTSVPHKVLNIVDESIVFKPVDIGFVRREIKKAISRKFSMMVRNNVSLEVEDDVIEKIASGLWHDQTILGEWIKKVLEPSFRQLKPPQLSSSCVWSSLVVRLVVEPDSGTQEKSFGYNKIFV